MLPTHGAVTSILHLANSILYGTHHDIEGWASAAASRSSFLAAAIDHRPVAKLLVNAGLVSSAGELVAGERLRTLARPADRGTLVSIAALLLEIAPPAWLHLAVFGREVRTEFIPSLDLASLSWLQPELEQLLLDAARSDAQVDSVLKLGLGLAAELVILAALEAEHASPVHVSAISDRFGYDIESGVGFTRRWEVKGCTSGTAGSFHLSRNEFEKCKMYLEGWTVVQVEFSADALTAATLTDAHVVSINELRSSELLSLVPRDSEEFVWESSAFISAPSTAWDLSEMKIPKGVLGPGFTILGSRVLAERHAAQGRK